jgi:hypothetical protein
MPILFWLATVAKHVSTVNPEVFEPDAVISMPKVFRFLLLASVIFCPAHAFAARNFALVIGIDNYEYVQHLDGARNDAVDMSQALQKYGTDKLVTLLDRQATKANVVNAWQSIMAEAQPGDTVFFSYAGHGAQAPELNAGDEKDGLDEFLVLSGFNPDDLQHTWKETIFDNEVHQWFADAGSRGIKVLFISDSCHAGGMDRTVTGKLRYIPPTKQRWLSEWIAKITRGGGASAGPATVHETPDNVTLVAATSEELPVPEVAIDGKTRGALSWTMARAIEGRADQNQDGIVTQAELEDYVLATVRIRSESLQVPQFITAPDANGENPMLVLRPQQVEMVNAAPGGNSGPGQTAMTRELGFTPVLPLDIKGTTVRPQDTAAGEKPYIWDAKTGLFQTPNGDIAAEKVTKFTVDDIVSKYILLSYLKAISAQHPDQIELAPEKPYYSSGERIKIKNMSTKYQNMVAFNLANTGEVQYIDMVVAGQPVNGTPLQEMKIVEPFGADHLVVISSDSSLEAIGRIIERGINPKKLLAELTSRLENRNVKIAIEAIYTHKAS